MNTKTAKFLLNKVKTDYDSIADSFSETRSRGWEEFDLYLNYIKDGDKILDLGCGNGRFYKHLHKNNKNISYEGVDFSEKLIAIAKNKYPNTTFKLSDITEMPYDNNEYDVVCSIASLHHIPSKKKRKKHLGQIYSSLKKNGILLLSVWDLHQQKYKKELFKAKLKTITSLGRFGSQDTFIPWKKGKYKASRYYYAYTFEELKNELLSSNFKIIKTLINNNFVFVCQKIS